MDFSPRTSYEEDDASAKWLSRQHNLRAIEFSKSGALHDHATKAHSSTSVFRRIRNYESPTKGANSPPSRINLHLMENSFQEEISSPGERFAQTTSHANDRMNVTYLAPMTSKEKISMKPPVHLSAKEVLSPTVGKACIKPFVTKRVQVNIMEKRSVSLHYHGSRTTADEVQQERYEGAANRCWREKGDHGIVSV